MAKKQKTDYEALASQIGNLGGENGVEQTPTNIPIMPEEVEVKDDNSLGTLSRPEMYGKRGMTPEEQKERDALDAKFDSMSRLSKMESGEYYEEDPLIAEGWVPVDRKELGLRSQFYSSDWQFYIRPATTQAIKNWISIDEKNYMQLNTVFDEIIKLCVKIKTPMGAISWSHVHQWDRFWFIMKVHQLTYINSNKAISFTDNCEECDNEITFYLTPESLHYQFPDEDIVEKHWHPETMSWIIDPEEYGVEGEDTIQLYIPTLATQKAVIDWAQRQYNRKKKVDETFTSTYLPWMLRSISKDEAHADKQIQKVEKAYKNWSVEFHSLMTDIIRNITVNSQETLKTVCPHCGEEVVSNVQFPNGIKVLFTSETGISKFGSR